MTLYCDLVNTVMNPRVPLKPGNVVTKWANIRFPRTLFCGVSCCICVQTAMTSESFLKCKPFYFKERWQHKMSGSRPCKGEICQDWNCYKTEGWRENKHQTPHLQSVYMDRPSSMAWNLFLQIWISIFVKAINKTFYHLHNTHHTNLGTTLKNQLCIPGEIRTDLSECVAFGR